MGRPAAQFYEFGPFRLDATERVLFRDRAVVPLKPKVFDTLLVLVKCSGHVIEKDELMKTLWPDTVVEENNLNQNISVLRRALGDGEHAGQFIETVPRRGYRFVASVRESCDESNGLVVEKHTLSSVVIEEEEREEESKNRFLTVRSFIENRKTIAASVLFAALISAGYFFTLNKSKHAETISTVKSVAVLPFKPLSAEGGDEYFGLGMTDALITRLGRINQIIVRPTSAVRRYTAPEQDPLAAGREQQVEAVLEGSIQRSGERVRVTVRLLNVRDGASMWAYQCDEQCNDPFAVEDLISERVATALISNLSRQQREQLTKRYTENTEAYRLYLKGRYYWNKRSPEGFNKAIGYFNQAIDLDPTYALAYAGLADCYNMLGDYALLLPSQSFRKGEAAAIKALEIDETLAEAHASLALAKLDYEWDFPAAEKEFQRALELKPNYATAHQWYGEYFMLMGRVEESLAEMRLAQELDPLSLIISTAIGYAFWNARRYDEAIDQLRNTLELDANFLPAIAFLEMAYERKGMDQEFIATQQKEMILSGYSPEEAAAFREAYAKSGMRGFWLKGLDWLKQEQAKRTYIAPIHMAVTYALLGEKDQAFDWLDKVYVERSGWIAHLRVDPRFDNLRSDLRYSDLLRRVGLAP
jgi:DNA-binding winged helix-turn-helix (wHTH) protein/TolB-like protein